MLVKFLMFILSNKHNWALYIILFAYKQYFRFWSHQRSCLRSTTWPALWSKDGYGFFNVHTDFGACVCTGGTHKHTQDLKTKKRLKRTLFNGAKQDKFFKESLFFKAMYNTKQSNSLIFCMLDSCRRKRARDWLKDWFFLECWQSRVSD